MAQSKEIIFLEIYNEKNEKIPFNDFVREAKVDDLNVYCKLCVHNSKDVADEIEITDGLFCHACEKNSARQFTSQLRSNDEGTGVMQICTRKTCKKISIIAR